MGKLKAFFSRRLVPFIGGIGRRKITTYAAAGTFFFFLSLAPIIMILCTVLPHTFITEELLLRLADNVIPESVMPFVGAIVRSIYHGQGLSLSVSIVITAWTASLTMASLMQGLSMAYNVERRESYLYFRLRAIFYMAVLLVSAVIALCGIVFGHQLVLLGLSYFKSESSWHRAFVLLKYGRYLVMVVFLTLVFVFLYRFTSGARLKIWQHTRGAVFTAVMWVLFSEVFSFYVSNYTNLNLFGILGTGIIAMLWLYYCLMFLLLGGYINSWRSENG